ncbi:ABC transporter substrate-binding protein [Ktedonobacter robiniae]|uniref:Sugar ABC transporter substrate-binding protein n=1 Tax=Ktedonobacter robiniae TaxID=2778365 RepID=A0ABQ3UWQ8_9CHLR|nr:extracellular solute-binding protein [Ktedonobacter robiniae]GHO57284.1 sugar ABC transporter substrate-binding protein [Ktedonobacter robiniae]
MIHASGLALRRRKVWLNTFFCLLALLSTAMGLAACAGSDDGKIHLTLWYWNRSISDNLIAQVNKQFPNIVLDAQKITDYDNKVRTSMAAHSGVPDIMGINSNISTYFPDEDQFFDLNSLGANDVQSQYLAWKWNLGIAPDGKMIGFPMDTGPTALFYRTDLFEKAGLPTDPEQVSAQLKTWDDYINAGAKLKQATNNKSFMFDNIGTVYGQMLGQSAKQYFDKSGTYLGDQSHIKAMWDEAIKTYKAGVDGKVPMWGTSWNQGVSNGYIASFVGAVWMKQVLQDAAPDTKGKWRIARAPGGDGNSGGSFLAITKYCQHPKEAFEVIKWLQSPTNQVAGYKDLQLYPSALDSLNDPALHQKEDFYGGEDTQDVFGVAVKNVPSFYSGPYDGIAGTAITDQLSLVEYQGKDPGQAWNDAQAATQRGLLR